MKIERCPLTMDGAPNTEFRVVADGDKIEIEIVPGTSARVVLTNFASGTKYAVTLTVEEMLRLMAYTS